MNNIYRTTPQKPFNFNGLIVDNFAGGGGASTGIEQALRRPIDIAINHDEAAVRMHEVNHPATKHFCESVWEVDPRKVCDGRTVDLAWFSPDCKHFSKAKGRKPVEKNIRGLAWVAVRWAATVRPSVIMLENVEEFKKWGPLVTDENGQQVPCKLRKGKTFESFVRELEKLGYQVEDRLLRASDFGAPTSRKRLFLIARCDGNPIIWPSPTHGPGLQKVRTAADIIDWSLPCPSIFDRKKPLAENTLKRIARGLDKFVFNNPKPFIVRIGQTGFSPNGMHYDIGKPLTTVTSKAEHCLVMPTLIQTGYGERKGQTPRAPGLEKPLGTVVAGGSKHALISAFLAKHYTGVTGKTLDNPVDTITSVDHHALVTSHMIKLRGACTGSKTSEPVPTISAGGTHIGEVRAFLIKYYSTGGQWQNIDEPLHTVPSNDRMGLVMVQGDLYQIADIGMRMLQPHELYAAQGFPDDYVFSHDAEGRAFTKTQQVAKCGNAVCPPVVKALVEANLVSNEAEKVA